MFVIFYLIRLQQAVTRNFGIFLITRSLENKSNIIISRNIGLARLHKHLRSVKTKGQPCLGNPTHRLIQDKIFLFVLDIFHSRVWVRVKSDEESRSIYLSWLCEGPVSHSYCSIWNIMPFDWPSMRGQSSQLEGARCWPSKRASWIDISSALSKVFINRGQFVLCLPLPFHHSELQGDGRFLMRVWPLL